MKNLTSMLSRARTTALLGTLVLVTLTACGENAFLPPGGEGDAPEITSMAMAPDPVLEGDTITLSLSARGSRNITQVNLSFRGAAVKDTVIAVAEPGRDIQSEIEVPVPFGTGPDSLLYLDAVAVDAEGVQSEPVQDTVEITDASPPSVQVSTADQVGPGETLTIQLSASDNRGLVSIGYVAIDPATGDTVASYTEPQTGDPVSFSASYAVAIPASNPPSALEVRGWARDRNQLAAESLTRNVGLEDQLGPDLVILETVPDSTVPLADSIQVRVQAIDPSGIRSLIFVGLAARGDTLLGTDTIVVRFDQKTITFPRPGSTEVPDTVIRAPYLVTADDTTSEAITVVVLAEDTLGNVTEVTKNMYVGGPDVSLVYPTQDVAFGVGQSFEVRVRISDTQGIDSAKVFLGGAMNQTLALPLPARTDTPFVSVQTINLPTTEGTVTLNARAWNPEEVAGVTRTINIDVLADPPSDVWAPVVSLTAEMLVPPGSAPRMEQKDLLRISVAARDEGTAGLERIGFKAVVSRGGAQSVITESTTFGGSNSLEEHSFVVPLDSLYALLGITGAAALDSIMPDELKLRIHAFAADTMGALACSVGLEEQRACTPSTYTATGTYEAADTSGLLMAITAVRGHTVLLDNRAATIADLALDTLDGRLFLSNITDNLVELLDLDSDPDLISFLSAVQVGSRPWGLFVGERVVSSSDAAFLSGLVAAGDTARTLIVGNSGGTNLSLVHLDANAANVEEVDWVRLQTPNTVLYELSATVSDGGETEYGDITYYDFSDRPQFLAQDSLLRIVYSTVDTEAGPGTTLRYAHPDPDPTSTADQPESRFFLTEDMVDQSVTDLFALGNIDSLRVLGYESASDSVELFTHEPGHPDRVLRSGLHAEITVAAFALSAQIDSVMGAWGVPARAGLFYPVIYEGKWILTASSSGGDGSVVFSDTTFVSASGHRGKIVIGEGAAAPTGRVIIWTADEGAIISTELQITDLINNASEQVLGVGLNWDGSLGVARGVESTYFFTPDLRLQGLYQNPEQGGAGAVFHPDHDSPFDGGHTDTGGAGVAFTGTPVKTIEVVNTFHFNKIAELHIRDNIVGPLRAGPPLVTDNGGLGRSCVGNDCVVAKLYGITDAGGVVILNVRRRDVTSQ